MTNAVDARARETPRGYIGEIRKVHRAAFEPVCENGIPILFTSEHEAELAAWHALRSHLCAEIVGDGPKVSAARSKAETLFGKVWPGKGRKPVEVRRVRR